MKKYILVFLLVGGCSVSAYADSPIGFGFKGGLSIAGENFGPNSSTITQGSLIAPTGGIFADLHVMNSFRLQLEANYIQKGSTLPGIIITGNSPTILGTGTFQNAYNYLEIPLLFKVQKKLVPDLSLLIYAGPSVSFLLNETSSITASGVTTSSNLTSIYPGTNWALDFGGGIELANFILDIRYGLGLSSAAPTATINPNYGQLNTLSFQLGYRLF